MEKVTGLMNLVWYSVAQIVFMTAIAILFFDVPLATGWVYFIVAWPLSVLIGYVGFVVLRALNGTWFVLPFMLLALLAVLASSMIGDWLQLRELLLVLLPACIGFQAKLAQIWRREKNDNH